MVTARWFFNRSEWPCCLIAFFIPAWHVVGSSASWYGGFCSFKQHFGESVVSFAFITSRGRKVFAKAVGVGLEEFPVSFAEIPSLSV